MFVHPAMAAKPFEGTIHLDSKSPEGNVQLRYFIRPQIMRMEMESMGQTSVVIQNFGKGKLYVLMPETKQYMETPIMDEENPMMGGDEAGAPSEESPPVKTGKTEKIHGYRCEQYMMKSPEGTMEIWVAKDFPTVKGLSVQWPIGSVTPFRVIMYDPGGKETYRQEITKVEKKKLADSLFKPPADYKKLEITMPDMPGAGGY
jgi:hypothetical protein